METIAGKLREIVRATKSPRELARRRGRSDLCDQVALTTKVPCQTPKKESSPRKGIEKSSGSLTR